MTRIAPHPPGRLPIGQSAPVDPASILGCGDTFSRHLRRRAQVFFGRPPSMPTKFR
jgi:hypothetical protein